MKFHVDVTSKMYNALLPLQRLGELPLALTGAEGAPFHAEETSHPLTPKMGNSTQL